jgi:hypothetical protein|tara:strand:- start:766 stop:1116 length:351 start_codon:yes stop_codon:yes gene_type:complete
MRKVPILEVLLSKGQFAKITKVFPAHELPIFFHKWGNENIEIVGKTDKMQEILSIEKEVERLQTLHGASALQQVFGSNFIDGIELSINRIIEKEKDLNGSENTAKSKNRTSSEIRV